MFSSMTKFQLLPIYKHLLLPKPYHSEIAMAGKGMRNIVLFPFMAHGHLNPFMALARQIERREGYTVTIVNTPRNVEKLRRSLGSETEMQKIRFAEIPFCGTDYGLPPGTENTDTLSYQLIARFLEATESFEAPFKRLLVEMSERDRCPPLCIVSDMFLGWTVKVAEELGIFHSVFIAGAGYSMAAYFSISLNMVRCKTGDEEFSLPDFPEAPRVQKTQLGDDVKSSDGTDSWCLFKRRQFSFCLRSGAILLNTIEGLGDIGVKYFQRKTGGKHVLMIGPAIKNNKEGIRVPADPAGCFSWLDLHPPGSVLYVSFGSQNSILVSQTMELAMGLEESGVPFIWVIRPPIGFNASDELRPEWLPDGFQDRISRKNQGVLVHRWAPQQEILAHRSIGAFLSHCGWNSVLESLCEGVPIIGWPVAGEQFFNSQMLEKDSGVSIEITRGIDSKVIGHDHIAGVIKTVMGKTEKGEQMRNNAGKFKKKMKDAVREGQGFKGASIKAMEEFLSTAIAMNKKPNFN